MNEEHDLFCIFREIGSAGIVFLERDGILLKRQKSPTDIMLGDINSELVEMLKQLREQNIRFGFVSGRMDMTAGSHGRLGYMAVTRILDELLRIRGALPDFWIERRCPSERGRDEPNYRDATEDRGDARMLLQAIAWYGADRSNAVFVSNSTAAILEAKDTGITSIHYSGWRSHRRDPSAPRQEIPSLSYLQEIADVTSLRAIVERGLGLARPRTA